MIAAAPPLRFFLWKPPCRAFAKDTCVPGAEGPEISVRAEDIVALEQIGFDDAGQFWRTRVHVRGGTSFDTTAPYRAAEHALAVARGGGHAP